MMREKEARPFERKKDDPWLCACLQFSVVTLFLNQKTVYKEHQRIWVVWFESMDKSVTIKDIFLSPNLICLSLW